MLGSSGLDKTKEVLQTGNGALWWRIVISSQLTKMSCLFLDLIGSELLLFPDVLVSLI